MFRSFIGVTAVATLTLSLAACSAGGGGGEKLDPAASPFATYWEALYGGYNEETVEAQQTLIEEQVAACMADEGFEYIPVDQSQNWTGASGEEWLPDSEEWVAQYGWGFINYPGRDEMEEVQEADMPVDPNQDYVTALSASEQTAYYETLYGVPPSEEEMQEGVAQEYNWEDAGCYGAAQQGVHGEDPFSDEKNAALMESMGSLYEDVQNDSRIVEGNAKWASCMADAGFSGYATAQDAQEQFSEELNSYYETMTDGITSDDPELTKLGEREIEIALADLACAEESGSRQLALRVQFDLEEQFITDNKAELDALLAEAEQGN